MLLALSLPTSPAQEYTRWALPDGAVARFGKGIIRGVLYSPDGTRLAVVSSVGIWLYDTTTYQQVAMFPVHRGRFLSLAFSPDGTTLASEGEDNTVRLWDTETGEQKHTLAGHTNGISAIAFSPDGKTLASGSGDATVRLWDTETGEHKDTLTTGGLKDTPTGPTGMITEVAFSPDGATLAGASSPRTVWLWDTETWEQKGTLVGCTDGGGCIEPIGWMFFSPDGATLAARGEDAELWLWDTKTWEHSGTLTRHTDLIAGAVFTPDGATLVSWAGDGEVLLWDTETWEQKGTLTGHTDWISEIAFSPAGKVLVSASDDMTVRLWDMETWEPQGDAHRAYGEGRKPSVQPGWKNTCHWELERDGATVGY